MQLLNGIKDNKQRDRERIKLEGEIRERVSELRRLDRLIKDC